MSQSKQVQIDELYIKSNGILSTEAARQNSSGPEGYDMKCGVLASEANNG